MTASEPMRGRYRPKPPSRRVADPYDYWWRDGILVVSLPLEGEGHRMRCDWPIPDEDMMWVSGPPEAPTLAVPIEATACIARGFTRAARVSWAGMMTGGRFLRLAPERKRRLR